MKKLALSKDDTVLNVVDEPYDESKWLYDQSEDKKHRYVLGTKGENPLICFGVNPSTASPSKLDKTIQNVEFFAKQAGYDSYIMLNLYPQRATDPKFLDNEKSCLADDKNFEAIKTLFDNYKELNILAAWGVTIEEEEYLKDCLKNIVQLSMNYKCNWFSLGQTKNGHPRHPSRLSHSTEMLSFDVGSYLVRIGISKSQFAINPITGEKIYKTNTVLSYGFSDKENEALSNKLPPNSQLIVCNDFSDIIAIPSVYQFVNPLAVNEEEIKVMMDFNIATQEETNVN